jgi:hypothetical protein
VQRAGAGTEASSSTEAAKTASGSAPAASATPSSSSTTQGRCSTVTALYLETSSAPKGSALARRTTSASASPS